MATVQTPHLRRSRLKARHVWRSADVSSGVGALLLVIIVAAAVLAPLIAPYPPNTLDLVHALQAPSWAHLMGTDDVGRDVFSRVLYGVRLDIIVVLFVTYLPLP